MRTLCIDALPVLFSGGISNYVTPLTQCLSRAETRQWQVELLFRLGVSRERHRQYRGYRSHHLDDGAGYRWTLLPDRITQLLWESAVAAPFFLGAQTDSVFISTTEMIPKMRKGLVGWIVYDFTPFHLSDIFSIDKAAFLETAAKRAERTDFIIAISENTKKDVLELIGYPKERVCVVYPGIDKTGKPGADTATPRKGRRPYIYYLGSLARSKNVDGMLRIFSRLVHEHRLDLDIVLTGKDFCGRRYWGQLSRSLKIDGRVHITGWITDRARYVLLDGALMLWQFSWYEGFGLPVLEAASRGIPVMHANRGSLPEILQNPDQMIDPDDEPGAATLAAAALCSGDTLSRWKQAGLLRARAFSWEKSADTLLTWMSSNL